MITRILASVLGGQRGSVWVSLLTKGETARSLLAPVDHSAGLTGRQKSPFPNHFGTQGPQPSSPTDLASGCLQRFPEAALARCFRACRIISGSGRGAEAHDLGQSPACGC